MKVYIVKEFEEGDFVVESTYAVFSNLESARELIEKDFKEFKETFVNYWEKPNSIYRMKIEEWDVADSYEHNALLEDQAMLSIFPQPRFDEDEAEGS